MKRIAYLIALSCFIVGYISTPVYAFRSTIKNEAYSAGKWNGDKYHGASRNAIRDKIQSILTSVKTIYIPANQMTPLATNGATAGTEEKATNDVNVDYFAFDTTTEELVAFERIFPEEWNLGTIKAKFLWSSATGSTAGDTVEWELQCGAQSDGDAIDTALGTGQVITDTLLANSGADRQTTAATPAVTIGGTPVSGDMIHCKVSRNVDGTDDMAEDGWLMGVFVQYRESGSIMSAW